MTQGDETAAKAILNPGDLGGGTEKVVFWGRGEVSFFFWEKESRDSWCSLHSPEGRRVRSGGGPRGLALERVGADGSGSQSSRRSCGAPGTSGQCQARGLDPAGGRSILPPPPGLWLLSAKEWNPSPHLFQRVLVGRIWEREA